MSNRARVLCVATAFAMALPAAANAQQYFGQNQVEYRHFKWQVIETEHFLVHYYPEEAVAAHDAARMAERSYSRLSRILGHQFREKKPIILFASRQDFAENSIFGDQGEGVGGVTDADRQRMVLPFTGDYDGFQRVLTHEMVHAFQYDFFSRGKAGANIQLLSNVNPPSWFMEGMAEYLALGPNHPLTTMWIRNAVANGNLPTIKQMTDRPDNYFPYRYGEALWRYVGERWGDAAIGQIIESIVTSGSVERGFQRELGISLAQLSDQWREATRAQYFPQLGATQSARDFATALLTPKITGGNIFLSPVLSPDGRYIAYYANGSFKRGEVFLDLYIADAHTGKRITRLIKTTTNPRFEELRLAYSSGSFSPDGRKFAFTAQTGGRDVLSIADVNGSDVVQLKNIPLDGVFSPAFSPDGKQIAFTGLSGGITDLYLVNVDGTNLRHLTQDRYGDLQPNWSPDGTHIAFATDRATTNFSDLSLGKLQIAVLDVRDGSIRLLPGQSGLNINPAYSPDGSAIAFVSDRNGIPNIYMHDLSTDNDLQVTNVLTGVSQFTETSPAISWARNDRLAFNYFDNNDYTVWYVDNPRGLARAVTPAPAPTVASAPASPTTPVRDSTPGGAQASTSTYRAQSGARPSNTVSASEAVDTGSVSSVATILADNRTGLPDTLTFKNYPYHVSFHPDYISGGTIGVSTGGGFGTQYGGGTTLVFGDLTEDHQIIVGGGINGRIQDGSLLVGYQNLSHRWQYSTSVAQNVAYLNIGAGETQDPQTGLYTDQFQYLRYVFRTISAAAAYPFNRFARAEVGTSLANIGRGVVTENYVTDGVNILGQSLSNDQSLPSLTYAQPYVALVSDNTLFGLVAPISGRRMRFSVAPTVGNVKFIQYLADYRRYDPVVFDALTFATRVLGNFSYGRDANLLPVYIGTPDFVRGYDQSSFYGGYSCQSFLGQASSIGSACSTPDLIGTRDIVFNEELRFPIIRRFDFGGSGISLPPVEGGIFYDAGLAWSAGQTIHLTRPANYNVNTDRYFLRSYGAAIRVNFFNFAVLNWYLARPLDKPNYNRFNWTFSIGVGY